MLEIAEVDFLLLRQFQTRCFSLKTDPSTLLAKFLQIGIKDFLIVCKNEENASLEGVDNSPIFHDRVDNQTPDHGISEMRYVI